jgi:serine/threonine-protein kinase HipA
MAPREPLGVWLYGTCVAELTSRRPGEVACRYRDEAVERWPLNTPLLSCSLPLTTERRRADAYFSGLLPEGQHRQAMAAQAGIAAHDTFGLLARFGKDVAGAAVIAAEDPGERPGDVVAYSDAMLAEEVAGLPGRPLALHDDSELSIAGLQDKLLLVALEDGGWGRPVHGRPSTHILKVEDRRYPGMVELEAACLRVANAVGLSACDVAVETIADVPCLIVSRFDRRVTADGSVTRLHQEDVCQALGRDAAGHEGRGKYERHGGPSLREVAALLDRFSLDPTAELSRLVRVVTFTVIVGNADAHGKNLALLHVEPGVVTLAPLYDTVPTVLWPSLRAEAAMAVDGVARLGAITPGDVAAEAHRWRFDSERAVEVALDTARAVVGAVAEVGAPGRLVDAVASRAEGFLAGHG